LHVRRKVRTERGASSLASGASPMLDLLYLAIGAAFLGTCVLYTIACDHL